MVTILVGQEMEGSCISFIVTTKVHNLIFPAISDALNITLLLPLGNAEPEGRPLILVTLVLPQLSLAVADAKVVTDEQLLGSVFFTILGGQLMVGAWTSLIVTLKEQVVLSPAASVARQITVVIPLGKG